LPTDSDRVASTSKAQPHGPVAAATPISLFALAVGTGVGVAGATLGSVVIGLMMLLLPPPSTATGNPVYAPPYSLVAQVAGFVITFLAGYAAGRRAKERALLHGGIVGGIILAIGGASLLMSSEAPLPFVVASAALTLPAAALGGWAAERRSRPPTGLRP
jgi:hypothetical protein